MNSGSVVSEADIIQLGAVMTRLIDKFDGQYAFLSNFHPSQVKLYGIDYPTVEHAFQAAKTMDLAERDAIRLAYTPGIAKRLGRRVHLREDWEQRKIGFMETLLRRKFDLGSKLWLQLRETIPAELVEGNHWNDRFWGATWTLIAADSERTIEETWAEEEGRFLTGRNQLGILLMKIRDEEVK